jgi:hypothetical protein
LRLQYAATHEEQEMLRTGSIVLLLGSAVLAASSGVRAQDANSMARCADIEDADARLACYDEAFGQGRSPGPAAEAPRKAAEEAADDATSGSEPLPLTDQVGAGQLDRKDRPELEVERFEGRVVECKRDSRNTWYFYFDNGQVWKQRSNTRFKKRECGFTVTISRDSFGYTMQIEGETKKLRVGRVR